MQGVLKRAKDLIEAVAPTKPEPPQKRATNAFHAVSVVPGPQACEAARSLGNKRFLSREAPKLPLRDCDFGQCTCYYAHHADRRKGPRRANEMGVALDGYTDREKRGGPKRGRRKTDKANTPSTVRTRK
jgi:hypothetical protein